MNAPYADAQPPADDLGTDYNQNADPPPEPEALLSPLQEVGARLYALAMTAVGERKAIEARWLDDTAQYNGVYLDRVSGTIEGLFQSTGGKKDQPFVNITRPKTNAAISRLEDLLLPTDDRNWGIQPTPVPAVSKHEGNEQVVGQTPQGAPVQAADIALAMKEEAAAASEAMQLEIADQLEECDYNAQQRDLLRDGCILGTGIMKGPFITSTLQKRWRPQTAGNVGVSVLQVTQQNRPTARRVDPWNFFPDMSATCLQDAEYLFERHMMTARQVAELAELPGFNIDEIFQAIEQGPTGVQWTANYLNDLRGMNDNNPVQRKAFEVWEYHGPLTRDELLTVGVPQEQVTQLQYRIEAEVWLIGNHVLKAQINPLETGDRPYSLWNYQPDPSCIFGFGVPWEMRNSQRGLNAAWRMLVDNAGLAVAPQIIMKQGAIRPADGEWKISARKVWLLTDPARSVQEAFATFEIPSRINEIVELFQLSLKLADDETGLPNIVNQEQGMASQSTVGIQAINTSSMATLRRIVKSFDDGITRPTIQRFYDWNMQYGEKEEIKGDYSIDARGSSVLLAKDLLARNLMQIGQVLQNPMFGQIIKPPVLLRKIFRSMQLPDDVVMSDQEIAAGQQQQQQAQQAAQQRNDAMFQASLQEKQTNAARNAAAAQNQQVMSEVAQMQAQNAGNKLPDPGDSIKLEINRIDAALRQMEVQAELTKSQNDLHRAQLAAATRMPAGVVTQPVTQQIAQEPGA